MGGGTMATPEEYQREKNRLARDALDKVAVHPGPMIFCDAKLDDAEDYDLRPWKVWRTKPTTATGIFNVRAYVEANTIHKSTDLDISDILKGAEWPSIDRGIRWTNLIILTATALFMAAIGLM